MPAEVDEQRAELIEQEGLDEYYDEEENEAEAEEPEDEDKPSDPENNIPEPVAEQE